MSRLKQTLSLLLSLSALSVAGYGVYRAVHSPLFAVRIVEVHHAPLTSDEQAPVTSDTITTVAAVPVGKANLFDLELGPIEKRILSNPWIKDVQIQKRFPQTVSITPIFREPVAVVQTKGGALAYVDEDGKIFSQLNLELSHDLPLLTGVLERPEIFKQAVALIRLWSSTGVEEHCLLSSLSWDVERGFRVVGSYTISGSVLPGRAMIDLGQDLDGSLEVQLRRLTEVVRYLKSNSIKAVQISADAGKKIVVKTARGS